MSLREQAEESVDAAWARKRADERLRDAAPELLRALVVTLDAMRALRGLAFTGSRIPTDRYPEKHAADGADALARAAIRKATETT